MHGARLLILTIALATSSCGTANLRGDAPSVERAMAQTTSETDDPMSFPGGDIDGRRLDAGEIYIGEPVPAQVPQGCQVAERYAAFVSAGEFDKVADLYTSDAVVIHSGGAPARGEAAIRAFYQGQIGGLGVRLVPVAYAVGPAMCLVQLAVSRRGDGEGAPEYFSASFDQFLLAPDGRAKMMVVYGRRSPVTEAVVRDIGKQP